MLKERLEFLRGPGGLRAAGYFGLKLIARIQVFNVVWTTARSNQVLAMPRDWRYVSLYTALALRDIDDRTIRSVTEQCGSRPEELFARAGSLHLLFVGKALAAQLSIDKGPSCRIDSPPLQLDMSESDTFMSYLYTWPTYRKLGAARHLIAATVNDLSERDACRVLAHIRATNVPSTAAFRRAGWRSCGTVLCTSSGRFLMAPGLARAGLVMRSAREALKDG